MMLIAFILLLCIALRFPKSRVVAGIAVCFILILYGFSDIEGDLYVYRWIYYDYSFKAFGMVFEPGFLFLIVACKTLSLSFTGFRLACALIYVSLLYRGIAKLTEFRAIAITSTIIFPLFVFISVMRSGIACVILLNAFAALVNERNRMHGIVKYCIGVVVATFFHYSSILLLAGILAKRKLNMKKVLPCLMLVLVFAVLLTQTDVIVHLVSMVTTREKTLQWLSRGEGTANLKGSFAIILILLVNYFVSKMTLDRYKARRLCGNTSSMLSKPEIVHNMAIILFFYTPLMLFASPFLRLAYMMFPAFSASAVGVMYSYQKEDQPLIRRRASVVLPGLLIFAVLLLWKLHYDLPYIKNGAMPLGELIQASFIIY